MKRLPLVYKSNRRERPSKRTNARSWVLDVTIREVPSLESITYAAVERVERGDGEVVRVSHRFTSLGDAKRFARHRTTRPLAYHGTQTR